MSEKYTYLMVDFCCIIFPFAFSFHPLIRFYKQWKYFLIPCICTALVFVIWDILFTIKGVWSFNPLYVCGIYLVHLPLEEYLFFLCIPYACVFTFYCISRFLKVNGGQSPAKMFSLLLTALLVIIAVNHFSLLYTSVTFLLLAVCLVFMLIKKVYFFPAFYIAFLIILIPFFISNGILTGSFIKMPVVIYNNNYNLGIRMFTIPVEDTFYGMLLMLMNVAGFEYLKSRNPFT